MKPVTVMIPIYNGEKFLKETIDSVLSQTFTDFDLLALDDGSTDKSPSIVKSYTDQRIKYIRCTHDFIDTLNKGLSLADSKYIALLDHDDIMKPERLAIQYQFMEMNPDIAACGGYMHYIGSKSWEIKVPLEHLEIMRTMLLYSPIQNPTGFIRRSVLINNNIQYERGYSFSADYKLWSEIVKVGKLATIPIVLTLYRVHDDQTSNKYHNQCLEGGLKVKFEMLDYLLSNLKQESKQVQLIENILLPAIDDIGETGIFSEDALFYFMNELIRGLIQKGEMDI